MIIRPAVNEDLEGIASLLFQVQEVHHIGRPDLFRTNSRKYTDDQIIEIINNPQTPLFVYDDENMIKGYAFCIIQNHVNETSFQDIKTLYIDDICVDENCRKQHVGKAVYEYVKKYAKENGFHNITLNVWTCNPPAMKFYESLGMIPQKIGMEEIL